MLHAGEHDTYEGLCEAFEWADYWDACGWDAREELNFGHETLYTQDREDRALVWRGTDGTEETYSFGDLADVASRAANALEAVGVERGDRVFTYMPRIPEHYAVIVGALKAGAVFGAVNERYGPDGIAHRLGDSRAATVVTTSDNLDTVSEAAAGLDAPETVAVVDRDDEWQGAADGAVDLLGLMDEQPTDHETARTDPEDPALLYYTSGTTGPAKGVLHAQRFCVANAAFADVPIGLEEGDLYWCTADPGWLTGVNPLGAWFWGHPIVVYEGEFDPETWVDILDSHPIDVLFSVPTAYRTLREHEELLDGADIDLRTLLSVGEPLDPATVEWAEERFGTPVLDTYGTSETYGTVVSNYPLPEWEVVPGSMGKPYPEIGIQVVEPGTLDPVDPGETGEIAVRDDFPSTFLRYWERPEKTEDAREDGWILTDDLATRDEDGYLHFQGRADDVILSAGYRIGPFDVEATLAEHEAVADAAVVPKPDEQRGNIVKAFVVPAAGAAADDETRESIRLHVRERLAAHEYPREIEFVEELPRTVTGKVRRVELREDETGA